MVTGQRKTQLGFTLIEMVISIVVMGILFVVMMPLLRMPAQSYMEAQRRIELQQQLGLIKSKLHEDLRLAMPGSIRFVQVGNRTSSSTWKYVLRHVCVNKMEARRFVLPLPPR